MLRYREEMKSAREMHSCATTSPYPDEGGIKSVVTYQGSAIGVEVSYPVITRMQWSRVCLLVLIKQLDGCWQTW